MKVCSEDMIRELQPGDYIVCKGKRFIIGEILHQDFYKDEMCYNNEDRSYIDIEFREVNGTYHHWKSNLDGGGFGYHPNVSDKSPKYEPFNNTTKTEKLSKEEYAKLFRKMFKEDGVSIKDCYFKLGQIGCGNRDFLSILLNEIGECVWED